MIKTEQRKVPTHLLIDYAVEVALGRGAQHVEDVVELVQVCHSCQGLTTHTEHRPHNTHRAHASQHTQSTCLTTHTEHRRAKASTGDGTPPHAHAVNLL